MRKITHIVLHCSATKAGQDFSAKDIDKWHRQRGFIKIGYHYVIRLDGTVEKGRDEAEVGAHVSGHNATTIGVCYVGGLDANGKSADTRTPEQKATMLKLVRELTRKYPGAEVLGHRDFPNVAKDCPCFDARSWWASVKDRRDPVPDTSDTSYTVVKGDTLLGIARKLGVDPFQLALKNGRVNTSLATGETLKWP